jgi:hypothetical protein
MGNKFLNLITAPFIILMVLKGAVAFGNPITAANARNASATSERSIAGFIDESLTNVHSVGFGIGETYLSGDLGKYGESNITMDLLYSYAATESFDFVADLHRSSHEGKSKSATISGLSLGIRGKIFSYDSLGPYVQGGLGFYRPSWKSYDPASQNLSTSETRTVFGWNIGMGTELRLNNHFSVGGLLAWHDPFDVKQSSAPSVEGAYLKFLVTTMYSF